MKKRVFQNMENGVFRVIIETEDWSEGDLDLIAQFGEPEVNVGGEVLYFFEDKPKSNTFGDIYVRMVHCFPYSRNFDSRDYGSAEEAVAVGKAWKELVLDRIDAAVTALRTNYAPLPTEEVSEI